MTHIIVAIVAACRSSPRRLVPQDAANFVRAKTAAKSWLALALTGAGEYSRSWDEAANNLKAAVTKSKWAIGSPSIRSPLGGVEIRTLKSAASARTLPGAPERDYVVLQFESSFEHRASAIETVTPLHEKDGSWRVFGNFNK